MTAALVQVTLPSLPHKWIDALQKGDYELKPRAKINGPKGAHSWMRRRPDAEGDPCKIMQAALDRGLANLEESASGSAHDELNVRFYELMKLAIEGHRGVYTAYVELGSAFVQEVTGRRRGAKHDGAEVGTVRGNEEARQEAFRSIVGAVSLMAAHMSQPEMKAAGLSRGAPPCSCWDEPDGMVTEAKDPGDYEAEDDGLAQHFIDLSGEDLLWVPDYKSWFYFDGERGIWLGDGPDRAGQLALKVVARIRTAREAKFRALDHADKQQKPDGRPTDHDIIERQIGKLNKAMKRLGVNAGMRSMVDVAKYDERMVRPASGFDADERLLHLPDGKVIELKEDGVSVREAVRSDCATRHTAAPYVPGAVDETWDRFLKTTLPDAELRWFVQRLFGYALLGGNPLGKLVFLHGQTSSGKSTIVEACNAAMGAYAGSFDLSLFREKQDSGARPDIVRVSPMRMIFSSEAGSAWHLHNDMIKNMTGSDTKSARLNHGNTYFERVPSFTPFIATNGFPKIENADPATWRRLLAVPFDRQFGVPGKDGGRAADLSMRDHLRASPAAHIAVLSWMVKGYESYAKYGLEGKNGVPEAVTMRSKEMRGEVSEKHLWLYERCDLGDGLVDSADNLYNDMRMYMLDDGVNEKFIPTRGSFGMFLTQQVGLPKARLQRMKDKDGAPGKVRDGIRLKR